MVKKSSKDITGTSMRTTSPLVNTSTASETSSFSYFSFILSNILGKNKVIAAKIKARPRNDQILADRVAK